MTDSAKPNTEESRADIIRRPPNQLHDLPVRFRWEVSRRHPYYLVFWSNARLYRHSEPDTPAAQLQLRQAAMLMLGAIGVTGEPVDPAQSFEELDGGDLDPAFLSGTVQPMTLRSIAAMLIGALPQADRCALAGILSTSADDHCAVDGDTADRSLQKTQAMSRLAQICSPALDSYPVAPLFYIHLGASQRTIVQDVEGQVRRWKRRRAITERRVPTDQLQSYLDVWDQREGWTGSGYQWSHEHTFAEISRQFQVGLSTVANRYCSAFQMITGHEFTPHLWWRLFGPLKFSALLTDPAEFLSRPIRRHLQSPVRRPVPESVVAPLPKEGRETGMVGAMAKVECDLTETDLLLDLEDFFSKGLSDGEIAQRLGAKGPTEIAHARTRLSELRDLYRQTCKTGRSDHRGGASS